MNTNIDSYFEAGCGRCPLGGTPQCKVHLWPKELQLLRKLILSCGLIEEVKWGVPCYTFQASNVLILAAFKNFCSLNFFKGALLNDENKLLDKQGENAHSTRIIRFTDIEKIIQNEANIKAYIYEAIEIEKAGLKIEPIKTSELVYPEELQTKLNENSNLKIAFEALTPGRQRGYIIHFSQPKQSKTRESRIEKCTQAILDGKGLND